LYNDEDDDDNNNNNNNNTSLKLNSPLSVTFQGLLHNTTQYISDAFMQWKPICDYRSFAGISVMYSLFKPPMKIKECVSKRQNIKLRSREITKKCSIQWYS
jgi:hypothetical protein